MDEYGYDHERWLRARPRRFSDIMEAHAERVRAQRLLSRSAAQDAPHGEWHVSVSGVGHGCVPGCRVIGDPPGLRTW